MQRWLPPLSTADLVVVGITLALIFSASRIGWAARLLEALFGRRPRSDKSETPPDSGNG
jgi:hypothetical protein